MEQDLNRYKQMEQYMTIALIADAALFFVYLLAAGAGTVWLAVICGIFNVLISGASLAFLFINKELTKPRSVWMTTAAVSIIVCLIFSLILGFPSPL